ncbi:hypothetical protein E5198_00695 [Pseudomonas sp. A-1]|nr:hypothetical protein E5198_00695 [Pseudomonas sp. A-1]
MNTIGSKEAERQRLASLLGQHLACGGEVRVIAGFNPVPVPPRTSRIDPETVLKRRKPKARAESSAGA